MSEDNRDISNSNFWKKAGDDYIKQEQYEKAIECFKEAIDLDPTYTAAWNNLGFSYFKLGRLDEAKKCKEKINELKKLSQNQSEVSSQSEVSPISPPSKKIVMEGKNPVTAGLLSIIPGLGQVYNGEFVKGILFLIGTIIGIFLIIPGILIWIYGIYDAYKTADKMNKGDKPFKESKWIHAGGYFSLIIVLVLIVAALGSLFSNESPQNNYDAISDAIPTPQYTIPGTPVQRQTSSTQSIDQVKATATTISYEELFRNNRNYIGDTVYFRGQIIQGYSPSPGMYVYRIATDNYRDVLYVNSQGSPFLVYDEVDLWGKVKGMKTYTSVLGNDITIPEIDAIQIELVNEPTPTITRVQKTFTQTPIVTNAPVTRYYNSKFKFSMNYPQNWFKSEEDYSYYNYKATSIEFVSATHDPRVKVTVHATNTNFGTVEEFFTKTFAEIDNDYDITVTKHQSKIDINGERAYRIDNYIKDENAQISTKIIQVFVVYDEFYYIITYSAPWPRGTEENLYDSYLTTAQEMIDSIQFL